MPEFYYPMLEKNQNEIPKPAQCPKVRVSTRSMPEKFMPDHSLVDGDSDFQGFITRVVFNRGVFVTPSFQPYPWPQLT